MVFAVATVLCVMSLDRDGALQASMAEQDKPEFDFCVGMGGVGTFSKQPEPPPPPPSGTGTLSKQPEPPPPPSGSGAETGSLQPEPPLQYGRFFLKSLARRMINDRIEHSVRAMLFQYCSSLEFGWSSACSGSDSPAWVWQALTD